MSSAPGPVEWIIILVMGLIIIVLLATREDSGRDATHPTLATAKISLEEHQKNFQILQTKNHDLAKLLRDAYSPDGDILRSQERAKELQAVRAQLRATESILQDTQSKLIVLEHGKSGVDDQQGDGPALQSPRKRSSATRS
ncbi:hypothetical protein BDZ45DRAFT_729589 [Acephala macrosclerotiorum]|nr:hypothetical protein BDZ45DRAFT_729589 [Acephala macrosclerotiorum]